MTGSTVSQSTTLPKDYEDSNKLLSQGVLLYNQIFYKEE